MAKECVKSAHNKLKAESNFRHEVEKTLGRRVLVGREV